jgi:hypothetical protein
MNTDALKTVTDEVEAVREYRARKENGAVTSLFVWNGGRSEEAHPDCHSMEEQLLRTLDNRVAGKKKTLKMT